MDVEPTGRDVERAKELRESLLAFIERTTRQRLMFRPVLSDEGTTEWPTAHLDRELARILAQARAEGRREALEEAAWLKVDE